MFSAKLHSHTHEAFMVAKCAADGMAKSLEV